MTIAHVDAFGGASGDMLLGALIDAGADLSEINSILAKLNLDLHVTTERVQRAGLAGTKAKVYVGDSLADPSEAGAGRGHSHADSHEHHHRGLPEIRRLIESAELPPAVAANALRVFERLAEAEALVHGTTVEQVHFHEVGAADAIGDIVGTCAAIHILDIRALTFGPLPTGRGTVRAAHGELPIPAPATLQLLRGIQTTDPAVYHEMLTPTGAALLVTLGTQVDARPLMTITAIGVGAGRRDTERANILRIALGTPPKARGLTPFIKEEAVLMEAHLDDTTGQVVAAAIDQLLSAGALDAWWSPCGMKKGRPGTVVSCLVTPDQQERLAAVLFAELPTLGLRYMPVERMILERRHQSVTTEYGEVRIKIGHIGERMFVCTPEYEDCRALAAGTGVAVREIIRAAVAAAAKLPSA